MKEFLKMLVAKYLESQARRLLKKYRPTIIAVAGSVGKTSTKLAVATVLAKKYRVLAHQSSYNSQIGLPLSLFDERVPEQFFNPFAWLWLLLKLLVKHRFIYPYNTLVLELGTDRPGDIAYLLRYLKPTVAVITAVTPEHMEGFGTMEAVLDEEFTLAEHSKYVLLNGNDVLLATKKKDLRGKEVYTYGIEKGDFRFKIGAHGLDGIMGQIVLGDQELHVQLPIFARTSLLTITAAAGVANLLGLTHSQITAGVEKVRPVVGRMNLLSGLNESKIIDDSYNSSPDAAIAALDTLYVLPAKRRLAILGSMNELGEYTREAHENVGRWCPRLDLLVTVGADAKRYLAPAALAAGLSRTKLASFRSPVDAGRYVAKRVRSGDIVLVKGSQNAIFTEEAVKQLLADPSDVAKLARQSPFWMKKKAKFFRVQ